MCSSKKSKTHPDGGWGWCVVVAAFITQFVVVGLQNSSGVIFNELVQKFNKPRGETGFVSSISVGMMFLLGPFTTSLCQRFTCRRISALGGFLCTLGMIASAYAHTLELMYISFGVVWGLGTSFCYFPAMIVLVPYFEKRLPLVTGIVSSGSGFGTLVLSPFIQWFAHQHGVKNAFLMLASLHGIVFFAGLVYRPVGKKYKLRQEVKYTDNNFEEEKDDVALSSHSDECQTEDLRCLKPIEKKTKIRKKNKCENSEIGTLFRNKAYVAWCFGLSVFILGYFVPFVHLVRYAVLIGIPEVKSAFLISTLSISATIFKLVSGKVAGLKGVNKMKIYQIGLLLMGIGTTLIPISHSFFGLMVYCVVYGFGESIFIVMIPLITKEIVGVNQLPLALGCVFMIMGIPTTVGAPIAGWIYDYFNDYSYAFFVAGCMNVVGVLIMFLVEYFRENDDATNSFIPDKTSKSSKENEKLYTNAETSNDDPFLTKHKCFGSNQQIFYADSDINKFNRMLCAECEKTRMKELSNARVLEEGKDYRHMCVIERIHQNSTKQPKYYDKPKYQRHLLKKLNESKTTSYSDLSSKIPMFLSENQTFVKKDHSKILITSNKNSPDSLTLPPSNRNSLTKNTSIFQPVPKEMAFLDNYEEDQVNKFIQVYNDEETGKLVVESIMTAV